MPEFTSALLSSLTQLGLNLLYAIVFVVIGLRLVKLLSKRFAKSRLMSRIDSSVASFISTSMTMVLNVAVLVISSLILGVPGSAFITIFGSAGVAIGLALQGSLSNLAGGLMLMFFRPFSVGDYIKTADSEGTVKQISAFYTTIVTVDSKRIVLPNGALTNNTLVNFSAEPTRMLNMAFSVAFDSDPALVRRILLEQANSHPMVLPDPAPVAPMTQHGDSALVFSLRAWTARENYKAVEFDLLESVKLAFDREGISIPYQQVDVHVNP